MNLLINNHRWHVQDVELHGICYYQDRLIDLDHRLRPRQRMETLIHEVLHALHPKWSEKKVERQARDLARAVWKDGFRRRKHG